MLGSAKSEDPGLISREIIVKAAQYCHGMLLLTTSASRYTST